MVSDMSSPSPDAVQDKLGRLRWLSSNLDRVRQRLPGPLEPILVIAAQFQQRLARDDFLTRLGQADHACRRADRVLFPGTARAEPPRSHPDRARVKPPQPAGPWRGHNLSEPGLRQLGIGVTALRLE